MTGGINNLYLLNQIDIRQAWRSPASLLTTSVRGCHEIDHLKHLSG